MQAEQLQFSFIIPLYNRPEEIKELLQSITEQATNDFEVVVVEDGSSITSKDVIEEFSDRLQISYYFKENSGPGDSRNYGMQRAKGNYFLILDSDCILPPNYMTNVISALTNDYVDCFGGIDTAMDSFTDHQKAINFAMTSVLTTGGIRGSSEKLGKFQPRSFNMGLSKKAFELSGGYKKIYIGEDIDLAVRLWKLGIDTRLFQQVAVFHKRRIDWVKYKNQVNAFGKGRPILNHWYPEHSKLTFYFPALFLIGFIISLIALKFDFPLFIFCYMLYFLACFIMSSVENKSIRVGLLSVYAVAVQFFGYGSGFITTYIRLNFLKMPPEQAFPRQFTRL